MEVIFQKVLLEEYGIPIETSTLRLHNDEGVITLFIKNHIGEFIWKDFSPSELEVVNANLGAAEQISEILPAHASSPVKTLHGRCYCAVSDTTNNGKLLSGILVVWHKDDWRLLSMSDEVSAQTAFAIGRSLAKVHAELQTVKLPTTVKSKVLSVDALVDAFGPRDSTAVTETLTKLHAKRALELYSRGSDSVSQRVMESGVRKGIIHGKIGEPYVWLRGEEAKIALLPELQNSYPVHDVAVIVSRLLRDATRPLQLAGAFLRAYAEWNPLREDEVALLSYLTTLNSTTSSPEELESHVATLSKVFHAACGYIRPCVNPSYRVNPTVTAEQLQASRIAVLAINWLAQRNRLHAVVTPTIPTDERMEIASGSRLCDEFKPFFPSALWPLGSSPVVYDFSKLQTKDGSEASFGGAAASSGPARLVWGKYAENRVIYTSEHFTGGGNPLDARTIHLGVDIGAPAGTPVFAPIGGKIHSCARNLYELDYGPCIILEHCLRLKFHSSSGEEALFAYGGESSEGEVCVTFYTLYGHLSVESILNDDGTERWRIGDVVAPGATVGWMGGKHVNGGWEPHLHFQIQTELDHGNWHGDYPGVCSPRDWPVYRLLCPDPNLLLRCPWIAPVGWHPADGSMDLIQGIEGV